MSESILTSTKKVLGLSEEYTAFDDDIIMHINSSFSILNQLGVGPENGFIIEDASAEWSDFISNDNSYNMIRSWMFLRVKMLFDPPTTSFVLTSMQEQLDEFEARISSHREWMLNPVDPKTVVEAGDVDI